MELKGWGVGVPAFLAIPQPDHQPSRGSGGGGIASARVYARGRCTTASVDGEYRLGLQAKVLKVRFSVWGSADFIGYRRASRTVAVRRRMAAADLTPGPKMVETSASS